MKKWSVVVLLVVLVLVAAMGLRNATVSSAAPVLMANGGAPVPPIPPALNGGAPVPPIPPALNGGAPVPPIPPTK